MNINTFTDINDKKIKVLNLYACTGGNRLLWNNCEVTAIEIDPILSELYKQRFPHDHVITTCAHQYLLENYKNFDFIWSSPPCQSHSKARQTGIEKYPDLRLYEEIIFLNKCCKKYYVVENVVPYYAPLVPGQKRGRHLFWANFHIPHINFHSIGIGKTNNEYQKLCEYHNYSLPKKIGIKNRVQIMRNMVHFETGLQIFNAAAQLIHKKTPVQKDLFS